MIWRHGTPVEYWGRSFVNALLRLMILLVLALSAYGHAPQPAVVMPSGLNWSEKFDAPGRLLPEELRTGATLRNIALGSSVTAANSYDANNLGVRTAARYSGGLTNQIAAPAGQPNVLGRIERDDLTLGKWTYWSRGTAIGAQTISATLDGNAAPVFFDPEHPSGEWVARLDLGPGSHTQVNTAIHPWNGPTQFSTSVTNTFTASATNSVLMSYDQAGNVITNSHGIGITQTLTWDVAGRLIKVSERNAQTNGSDFTAVYDPLGRRLKTEYTPVSVGVPITSLKRTADSCYDPQVEFLETGVSFNGEVTWMVLGPDLDGTFGGLQGIGGLEATIRDGDGYTTAAILDSKGNVAATLDTKRWILKWAEVAVSGFGCPIGISPPELSYTLSPAEAAIWRSRRIDPTGWYYLGMRYYDPVTARFLSPAPMGHTASLDLYSYAENDPINHVDPDGRIAKGASKGAHVGILRIGKSIPHLLETSPAAAALYKLATGEDITQRTDAFFNQLEADYSSYADEGANTSSAAYGYSAAVAATVVEAAPLFMGGGAAAKGASQGRGFFGRIMAKITGRSGTAPNVPKPSVSPPPLPAAKEAEIIAQNGTKITGFTGHGIERVKGDTANRAGTKPQAILDALKNPQKIVGGVDQQGRPFQIFTGGDARVVVNPQTGKVISVNPLSGAGAH